jgi:hypothetical protein
MVRLLRALKEGMLGIGGQKKGKGGGEIVSMF